MGTTFRCMMGSWYLLSRAQRVIKRLVCRSRSTWTPVLIGPPGPKFTVVLGPPLKYLNSPCSTWTPLTSTRATGCGWSVCCLSRTNVRICLSKVRIKGWVSKCEMKAFSYNLRKFWASENQKNRTLPLFSRTPYTQQLIAFVRFCHPEVNDVITKRLRGYVRSVLMMSHFRLSFIPDTYTPVLVRMIISRLHMFLFLFFFNRGTSQLRTV